MLHSQHPATVLLLEYFPHWAGLAGGLLPYGIATAGPGNASALVLKAGI